MKTIQYLVYLSLYLIYAVISKSGVTGTSLAHSVFLPADKSENPFSGRFIQRVVNMDPEKLRLIPQLEDNEFLSKLMNDDDDTLGGSLVRLAEEDPYEAVFDDKLDDQLMHQDNIDGEWVNLMTAGPLAVNYISNLLVIGSKRDFPLTRPPNFSFQYIKDPDSFRATLAQVSGSMYSALINAHTAMDRIQLNIQTMPNHIKTALKLVISGSPAIINMMLPKTLENILRIANESAQQAQVTYDKFSALQNLVAEVVEANSNTQSSHQMIIENIVSQINQMNQNQSYLYQSIDAIKAQYENAKMQVEKARQEYEQAANAAPWFRGWLKRIFRKIINTVVQVIQTILTVIGCILGKCYTNRSEYETAKQNAKAKAELLAQVLKEAENRYHSFSAMLAVEQGKLQQIINQTAALDLDRLNEQEIIDILIQSIVRLSKIKEQWGRLVQFFSKLSVQADSTQEIIVHEFVANIKEAQSNNLLLDPSDREFFAEVLGVTCQEIERGSHLLYVMSKTYHDISTEYMLNQISTFNRLLHLQTDYERSTYLRSISLNITVTSTRILQLAQSRQNEYVLRNKQRREEYEKFVEKMNEEDLGISIG